MARYWPASVIKEQQLFEDANRATSDKQRFIRDKDFAAQVKATNAKNAK